MQRLPSGDYKIPKKSQKNKIPSKIEGIPVVVDVVERKILFMVFIFVKFAYA